ncbi:hypothetical protein G6L37_06825 [Agrobacterium rubi]|nr:hypothetical protein [Agrobacterium rubi]NTF25078.1 hypothetical protein [Agrobacterium rubi]
MGVDTKSILISNPNAVEIAQAITEAYGFEPSIRVGLLHEETPDFFILTFPDTQDASKSRQLNVHLKSSDNEDVFDGPATQCSLGMWGGSIEIMDMLASKFGGFVCDSDCVGDWRAVDPVAEIGVDLPPLTPEAVLSLALSKLIDIRPALVIRELAKDREQFAKLMTALDEYRSSTAGSV